MIHAPSSYSIPGFPGQSQTFSDLYYNRYRDYDSSTGRYIQADPIGLAGGPSPYSYAMNNPLRYTDPLGLMTYWEYLTGTPDSYRVNIMNGIAGVSDGATFGATNWIRELIGVNDEINACNDFYGYGEWGSLLFGGGRLAYAGGAKVGAMMAADGAAASAFRNAYKRAWRGPLAGSNYRIHPYDDLLTKYGSDAAVKAAAGRTNPYWNTVGAGAAVGGGSAVYSNE